MSAVERILLLLVISLGLLLEMAWLFGMFVLLRYGAAPQ